MEKNTAIPEANLFERVTRDRPRNFDASSFDRALLILQRVLMERYDRPSLVTKIACETGAEIIEGLRAPGDELNSVDLATRFKTSRTPIRDALMLLEKEGLIDMLPRRRARVATPPIEEIGEIYRVRAALFETVASDVVSRATEDDIALLAGLIDAMADAERRMALPDYVWANVEFYTALSNIGRNRTAARLIDSLLLRTLPHRRLSLSLPGRMARSLKTHAQILDAVTQRDETLARALIRSNHLSALEALQKAAAEGH
ncbi:GntR family transcriptional regulator [Palleronia abyssalis]|uniref:HTH-type transcriptional repressor RspR n=1 Tax=Palleronia abyssalis TaxID=1501240 RepID=A0A2R8BWN5_9RHOB|nr:GntR family transcriptional regulator [Palleronia abyssalis]SPJ24577.1 HTH-type transcriptional repressor RspR [Palleronia abyssalis]